MTGPLVLACWATDGDEIEFEREGDNTIRVGLTSNRREGVVYLSSLSQKRLAEWLPEGPGGAGLIAAERNRQRMDEGYAVEHDDTHTHNELALAAVQYALPEGRRELYRDGTFVNDSGQPVPVDWPWGDAAWKPSPDDRVRELVKAGALIAAEIDRLLRADA